MCLNFGIHCNCSSTASQVGTQSCVHLALKTLLLCDLSLPVSTEEFGILAILKEVFCGFTQYLKVYIKIVTRIKLGPFPFTKLLAQNRDSIIYIATSYGMGCSGFKFKEEREFLTSRTIHSGSGDHLVSYSMHIWFILGGYSSRSMMTIYFHLVLRLRMSEAILHLSTCALVTCTGTPLGKPLIFHPLLTCYSEFVSFHCTSLRLNV